MSSHSNRNGKGAATATKHIVQGIIPPLEFSYLTDHKGKKLHKDTVKGIPLPCDAKGMKGKKRTTMVIRTFPIISEWMTEATFSVIDDKITEPVFLRILRTAGLMVGVGRWRPENGGQGGRFKPIAVTWSGELPDEADALLVQGTL